MARTGPSAAAASAAAASAAEREEEDSEAENVQVEHAPHDALRVRHGKHKHVAIANLGRYLEAGPLLEDEMLHDAGFHGRLTLRALTDIAEVCGLCDQDNEAPGTAYSDVSIREKLIKLLAGYKLRVAKHSTPGDAWFGFESIPGQGALVPQMGGYMLKEFMSGEAAIMKQFRHGKLSADELDAMVSMTTNQLENEKRIFEIRTSKTKAWAMDAQWRILHFKANTLQRENKTLERENAALRAELAALRA